MQDKDKTSEYGTTYSSETMTKWWIHLQSRLEKLWFDAEEPLMTYHHSAQNSAAVVSQLQALAIEAMYLSQEVSLWQNLQKTSL